MPDFVDLLFAIPMLGILGRSLGHVERGRHHEQIYRREVGMRHDGAGCVFCLTSVGLMTLRIADSG
jgi:hypothetical protein